MSTYFSFTMSDDSITRCAELVEYYTDKGLTNLCHEMRIAATGTKAEKAERIVEEDMKRPTASSETRRADENVVMDGLADDLQSTQIAPKTIAYKDIAGSFRKFKGDDSQDITAWLKAFDKICQNANWTGFDKITNLKKSLEEAALDVVELEGDDDYETAKAALRKEFAGNSTPARLIRVMTRRKKADSESVLQYMAEMKRWGRTAGMDDRTIGQFVVDGLNMEEIVKITFSRITDLS